MKSKKVLSSTPHATGTLPPTHEQIEALAHAIWVDRGQPEGRDLDNWLEAERELKGDVRTPLAADDIPADNRALEPNGTLEGKIERELDDITGQKGQRSPTSL
jgi:hypothetical protein